MNHAVTAQPHVSAWCWVLMLATAVLTPPECHVQQEARASAQAQIARSFLEPNRTSQQVPGQLALQLQHDKPLFIEGCVLDADGKPLKGANVAVIAKFPFPTPLRNYHPQPIGQTTTDRRGTFRATMPSLPLHQVDRLYAIARRAGYGIGTKELDYAALQHKVTFRLDKEQPVRGQVVGPDGSPAAGVKVHLCLFYDLWPKDPLPVRTFGCSPELRPSAWPEPSTTDEQGRFVLRGIHRSKAESLVFQFSIDDQRFAPLHPDLLILGEGEQEQAFQFRTDGSEELTLQLEAPRFVEGTVICKDTKKPIAGAWLSVIFSDANVTGDLQTFGVWIKADQQGRFRVRGWPRHYLTIYVYPPVGLPYPAWVEESTEWPDGVIKHEVTIEVPRGILVHGKVVEEQSGSGVSGASVEYQLRYTQETPYPDKLFPHQIYWAAEYRKILTGDDGTFKIAVVPGLGHLMVKAPNPDFVSRYITHGELQYDKPGGFWYVLEGLVKINPKPGIEAIYLTIPLRRGLTVSGHVVGPDGELVDKAVLLTTAYPRLTLRHFVPVTAWPRLVIDGCFELRGCDPAKPRRVYFLDAVHQWGATVSLDAAKAQRKPLTVRLLPCGSARVRFVDQDSHPLANAKVPVLVYLMFVKGPVNPVYMSLDSRHLRWWMTSLDRYRYGSLRADAKGRIMFPTLIPGAPYMLQLKDEPLRPENLKEKEFDFTVQPGQTLNLGEITLKRP